MIHHPPKSLCYPPTLDSWVTGGTHEPEGSGVMRPYDRTWRKIRLTILTRDGHRCQINGPRCTTTATTVDHITELARGGPRLDPTNLRAACKPCNSSLGAATGNRLREPRSQRWY